MKFQKQHHADLVSLIEKEFHFVKRKGRIIAQARSIENRFSFFLNKDMCIDEETGRFYRQEIWEVKIDQGKSQELTNWNEVKSAFSSWLSDLDFPV